MKEKWSEIKENLKKMLESGIFKVWIAPLKAEVDGCDIRIFAPNDFMADWLKRHLQDKLIEAAIQTLGVARDDLKIKISCGKQIKKPASSQSLLANILPVRGAGPQNELPVRLAPFRPTSQWQHSFEDFVTGPSNNMAVAAAKDMCQSGQVRTLFVNSGPGLGKTHLAQAAGRFMTASGTPAKVAYITADQFASRFVAAMRAKELEDFKQYLCGLDMLLLEDVHFLQRKKAMQEMALGVIKNLQSKGARVIFTSSFSPRQLQDMDDQLISHFCSGILTSMERPDMEMRREILRRKAKSFQVLLPDEVCDLLSRRLSHDVRQLESCLNSMIFKAKLLHSGLTVELAMETLGQYAGAEVALDLAGIVKLVCESFGVSEKQLCSRSRKQEYVQGRNTIFYLARKHTELSLEDLGARFNRKHSTVLRSITQVEQELARESRTGRQIARAVELIERKCGLGAIPTNV